VKNALGQQGAADDGTTDANETIQALVDAVVAAGEPAYSFFDVDPEDNTSGGVPGGNIRNAFLHNHKRVKLDDFKSLTPKHLSNAGAGNPNPFDGTRDPLEAKFEFDGLVIRFHPPPSGSKKYLPTWLFVLGQVGRYFSR
jgi:predicted extracellular nuclease